MAARTKELKEYQDEPSPQADLEKIPMLAREDIKREAAPFINEELNVEGTTVLHQNLFTSGINYIRLLFDAKEVPADLIPYLGLLTHVLGYMDTDNYNYGELFNEINCHTGGITSTVNLYGNMREPEKYRIMVELRCKALVSDTDFGFAMMREILSRTRLTDTKRLYEIVAQVKSRLQMYLTGSGHSAAAVRAMAEFSDSSWVTDQISGIAFYGLIEQLEKHFEEKKDQIVENLKLVMQYVLRPENLIVSCTSETDGLEAVKKELPALKVCLNTLPVPERTRTEELLKRPAKREGIKTPSAVQYVARAGHIKKYYGTYRILKVILSYDYLWIQVRVKGGAYGCMSGFGRDGDCYMVSYLDPKLAETNEVYDKLPEYLEQFDQDERSMDRYVIGAISEMDIPKNPAALGVRGLTAYLSGITREQLQKERDEVIDTDAKEIRELVPYAKAVLSNNCLCVVGNENKIKENSSLFTTVRSL